MKFELEPDNRGASDATLLEDLRAVAKSLGKDYVTKAEYNERGRWSSSTIQNRFGSWCKAHELTGLKRIRYYDATAEACIRDVERVAKELGKTTLTESEYERFGKIYVVLVTRRCGSWEAAVTQAGLEVSPLFRKRATDEELFENLEHLWECIGRQPKGADFVPPLSRYSSDIYARRFGSLRKALEAFVASFEGQAPERPADPPNENTVDTSLVAAAVRHKTSRTISWRTRFLVMRRDSFKCAICGGSPALNPGVVLVVDHIVPWTCGGETIMGNLQTLCEPCNGGKSNLPMNND